MHKKGVTVFDWPLQHACCVVRPGRSFLRSMIALAKAAKELQHRIRLNRGCRSDLQWWECFLPDWNGVSMMSRYTLASYWATVTSDASGSWGCGAYSSSGEWFQFEWPAFWLDWNITIKEFLPILLGVAIVLGVQLCLVWRLCLVYNCAWCTLPHGVMCSPFERSKIHFCCCVDAWVSPWWTARPLLLQNQSIDTWHTEWHDLISRKLLS